VKSFTRCALVIVALLISTHRLPAPISEIETPTPTPKRSATPKPKRTVKSKASESSEPSPKGPKTSPQAKSQAAAKRNAFDGTWKGRLTGLSGKMPYELDVTLVVSGNTMNSTLTGGGFDHVPWHTGDKLSFDGNTMRTASIKGDWRLILNADGRTAVVTADCGFFCNMGQDHWSGTFTRVGAE